MSTPQRQRLSVQDTWQQQQQQQQQLLVLRHWLLRQCCALSHVQHLRPQLKKQRQQPWQIRMHSSQQGVAKQTLTHKKKKQHHPHQLHHKQQQPRQQTPHHHQQQQQPQLWQGLSPLHWCWQRSGVQQQQQQRQQQLL
jgi:hypothetical protein